uniref:Myelin and lymphocyte protein n=1 Tax=Equus asinus TaxID=9793 RepID=A0A9L0JGN4_EQUAS|nr:myelin and lymphocyte protein-like [Equus asinus]
MAESSGSEVFTTFLYVSFILEFVFGGLVWILIASSQVPLPLLQGWVMFVSVFCFIGTTVLLFLYMCGSDNEETPWLTVVLGYVTGAHYVESFWRKLDAVCHSTAALFYLSAFILEAWAASTMRDSFTQEHYLENVFAAVFSYVATLLYMVHAVFSLIRWKKAAEEL